MDMDMGGCAAVGACSRLCSVRSEPEGHSGEGKAKSAQPAEHARHDVRRGGGHAER